MSSVIFLCALCFLSCEVYGYKDDIAEDYYFFVSTRLRSEGPNGCGTQLHDLACALTCPEKHVCINQKCFCVTNEENAYKDSKLLRTRTKPSFVDLTRINDNDEDFSDKPSLRHHIAHFCPNLNDARECIRNCMKVGKPAFCGKDHVCYCGHDYISQTKDNEADSKAIYAQFQDLYQKYFGDHFKVNFSEEDNVHLSK